MVFDGLRMGPSTLRFVLRRPGPPLAGACVSAVLLALTGLLAHLSPVFRGSDAATLQGFVGLNRPRLSPLIEHVAHLADPRPYALVGLALAAIALARGRPRVAVAIPIVLVAAGAMTESLKLLLAHPRFEEWLGAGQIAAASWPSGHATAAMSLALCAVLAAPPRARPTVAALGGAFAIAVSYAILVLAWHFPSDVLGGFLVASLWTLLAVAAVNASEVRWPSRRPAESPVRSVDAVVPVLIAALSALLGLAIALGRPDAVASYAEAHTTFVLGAAAIAAIATALAAGLARGIRS